MNLFDWLFGWTRDNRDRRDQGAERKISPAMPMAGAGSQISGEHPRSETEDELRKAVGEKSAQ